MLLLSMPRSLPFFPKGGSPDLGGRSYCTLRPERTTERPAGEAPGEERGRDEGAGEPGGRRPVGKERKRGGFEARRREAEVTPGGPSAPSVGSCSPAGGHAGSGVQDCHPEEGHGGPRQITVQIPGYTVCKTVSWPRNLTIIFQKSKLYNCYSIADQAGGGSPVGDPRCGCPYCSDGHRGLATPPLEATSCIFRPTSATQMTGFYSRGPHSPGEGVSGLSHPKTHKGRVVGCQKKTETEEIIGSVPTRHTVAPGHTASPAHTWPLGVS